MPAFFLEHMIHSTRLLTSLCVFVGDCTPFPLYPPAVLCAVRLRDVTRKLAVAHWAALIEDDAQAAQDAFDLQEEIAKLTISASINNEDMFIKVYGWVSSSGHGTAA